MELMSQKIVKSRSEEWENNQIAWMEQDLAVCGGKAWTDHAIHLHYLESSLLYTSQGCETRHYARRFYATNAVPVRPAIQKVQNSAQASQGDYSLNVGNEYMQNILDTDIDGAGNSSYNWITGKPLEKACANSKVFIGFKIPPAEQATVTVADYNMGRVKPPCWFYLCARDVYNCVEKDGPIEDGQFSQILYSATYPEIDPTTGFVKHCPAVVLYTEEEIITYSESGRKVLNREPNTLGYVPIWEVNIGESLIGEGVQYSKLAVELESLATSNMRDGYFNIIQSLGFEVDGPLNADTLVITPESDNKIEFAAPNTAPEVETREKIKALQEQFENSVQQAHSNFSRGGATIGSGVAYKEMGSQQAQSVKFIMDTLLEKFCVSVKCAMKAIGQMGEIEFKKPMSYEFVSEDNKIEQAEALEALTSTALSPESKKAINSKKLEKLFPDAEFRKILIEADNAAIDGGADSIPEYMG